MLPYKSGKCRLTSGYGYRTHPVTGAKNSWHGGIDLVGVPTSQGDNNLVRAVCSGMVAQSRIVTDKANATWQWGEYIAILGNDGVTIYYCHLAKRLVTVGQTVTAGQVIGHEGSTGQVTGQHLHFECRRGTAQINAAEYLGIPNAPGTYSEGAVAVEQTQAAANKYSKGDKYTIKTGDMYSNGVSVPTQYVGKTYTVYDVRDDRILIAELMSWVKI